MLTASKSELVSIIRAFQTFVNGKVPAESTLMRLKTEDLRTQAIQLLGNEYEAEMVNGVAKIVKAEDVEKEFQEALEVEGIDTEEADEENAEKAEEKVEVKGRRGGRALQPNDAVITVLVTSNPKREGSASYARFAQLKSGMKVVDFIAAVEKATGSASRARRTLRKAVAAGMVRVD